MVMEVFLYIIRLEILYFERRLALSLLHMHVYVQTKNFIVKMFLTGRRCLKEFVHLIDTRVKIKKDESLLCPYDVAFCEE